MNKVEKVFNVYDYDLAATLTSGQAFRWRADGKGWVGIIGPQWVRLEPGGDFIIAKTGRAVSDWNWLAHYLQIGLDLNLVLDGFPDDEPMRAATSACRGLRLLRQNPWECLASFILSSTKQIVQIQQIISILCERFGESVAVPAGYLPAFSFPSPERLAHVTENELRECKMGFRAPYLLAAAQDVAAGNVNLNRIQDLSLNEARVELLKFAGVGPKIADCVLLFAYGFPGAFPVDVWVMKALRQLYFPRRQPTRMRLERFVQTYFGMHSGFAQQYLFHYMRTIHSQTITEKLTFKKI